jgi:tRNA (pseudouridine54-N1)-methyltransferase
MASVECDLMREFVVYSRLGRTEPSFGNLHDAGRLDIVYECIVASLFLSHAIRKDVVFHAILSGPPAPPLHLRIEGATLHDVRTDQQTWERILRNVLGGQSHPGITTDKTSFEALLKTRAKDSQTLIYVLEEKGRNISEIEMRGNVVFVLGDHIGLPKIAENFALRFAEKVSLGKQPYLAASCVTILNYLMDRKAST